MVKQERKKSQGKEANADRKLNVPFFNHLDNFVSHFSFTIQTDTVVTQQHQTYRWWNEKSSRQDFCFIHLCSKSGSLSDTNQILWSPINFPCSPRSRWSCMFLFFNKGQEQVNFTFMNLLHPKISIHILQKLPYTFTFVMTRRILAENHFPYFHDLNEWLSSATVRGIRCWSLLGLKRLIKFWVFFVNIVLHFLWFLLIPLNPLTPRSDQHKTSPYNIHTFFSKQVMRTFKLIR